MTEIYFDHTMLLLFYENPRRTQSLKTLFETKSTRITKLEIPHHVALVERAHYIALRQYSSIRTPPPSIPWSPLIRHHSCHQILLLLHFSSLRDVMVIMRMVGNLGSCDAAWCRVTIFSILSFGLKHPLRGPGLMISFRGLRLRRAPLLVRSGRIIPGH